MLSSLCLAFVVLAQSPGQSKQSLDFWVGEWNVTSNGQRAGMNRIEKVLGGAAVIEHWKDAAGGEGKSLFYWMADKKKWKQVWVTPDGSYKEKVAEPIEGGLLFTGTAYLPSGTSYQDRTHLTKMADGAVRQVIEYWDTGSKSWKKTFEAIYRRKA